jgi:hypothetical protein
MDASKEDVTDLLRLGLVPPTFQPEEPRLLAIYEPEGSRG